MSETATRLTDQQKNKVKEWLNKHDLMRCKVCHLSNMAPPTIMVTLAGETSPSEHNVFMVPLSCPYCAHTMLFNAATMGIA